MQDILCQIAIKENFYSLIFEIRQILMEECQEIYHISVTNQENNYDLKKKIPTSF